jgi:5-methyltetrahydropteroyltriglutamate--homocysteine methyltransferase
MTPRTTPPFRADHVGSLLRPAELRRAHQNGTDPAQLRALEDEAVTRAVRMQEEIGLQAATDGELRRNSWHMDFIHRLGGISAAPSGQTVEFHRPGGETITSAQGALHVEGPVHLEQTIFGDDFTMLSAATTTAVAKQTIPSPNMIYTRGGRAAIDAAVYPDLETFWADVTAAYREEMLALHALGCRYLQFDDTSLAMINDPQVRARYAARGDDAEHLHVELIGHLNDVLAAKPEGMACTTHMCRGNYRSAWAAQGSYDFVAEALFGDLNVDGFFVEFDDERSGGFEPLRFVPRGKMVVLGLVTTKTGALESKDELKRRIEEASRYIDVDQLCLSPQCGFASTAEGNALTDAEQAEKLRLVVETAAEVWS